MLCVKFYSSKNYIVIAVVLFIEYETELCVCMFTCRCLFFLDLQDKVSIRFVTCGLSSVIIDCMFILLLLTAAAEHSCLYLFESKVHLKKGLL